jgi:NAD-dependent deacetylase
MFAGLLDCSSDRIVPSPLNGHKESLTTWHALPAQETISTLNEQIFDGATKAAVAALVTLARPTRNIVAFTGAGISTESGIPDYRGPSGVWERKAPPTLQDFRENPETRRRYWSERQERYPSLRESMPNRGHLALARLEQAGRLSHVITQNIDGLHQKAGNDPATTIELHGTAHRVRCLDCEASWPALEIQDRLPSEPLPACQRCGGMLRAATVLFGEALPDGALRSAIAVASACDFMLVVGSSLIVQPAARIPEIAVRSGALLAIVNNEATPLDDLADIVVHAPAGDVLSAFSDALLDSRQQDYSG